MHIALSPLMWVSIWSSRGLYAYWNDPRQFDTHLPVFSFSHCGTLIQFRFLRLQISLDNLKHACQLFQNCCCIYSQNYHEHKKSVWTLGAYCILANFSWAGKLRPPQYDADQQVLRNFLATTFLGSASKISSWWFENWNWNLSCCKIFLVFRFAAMFRTMGTGASPQAFSPSSDLHQQSTLVWHTRTYRKWLLMFCYFRWSN